MSNIRTAKVTIEGTRPLFWHKFGREALPLEKKEKTGVAGNDPEEWRKTVMVNKEGQLYLEPTYAFATIIGGSKFTKKGRGSIQKDMAATLQVLDNRILVDRHFPGYPNGKAFDVETVDTPGEDTEEPVYLDVRGVRNPSTRARNVRYRIVASPGWSCSFSIIWDVTIVSTNQMEASLNDAGKLVGIGNARAIGMGRFDVTEFEVEE
ncbi:MAG: hypothetical protein ACYSQZ_09140 [Planctomycetota bacterium]